MISYILGIFSGIALVIFQPDILNWFVTSGLRDNIVAALNGV